MASSTFTFTAFGRKLFPEGLTKVLWSHHKNIEIGQGVTVLSAMSEVRIWVGTGSQVVFIF